MIKLSVFNKLKKMPKRISEVFNVEPTVLKKLNVF